MLFNLVAAAPEDAKCDPGMGVHEENKQGRLKAVCSTLRRPVL